MGDGEAWNEYHFLAEFSRRTGEDDAEAGLPFRGVMRGMRVKGWCESGGCKLA